ncbi:hypothetical protein Peur_014013 [Populus x canadensis]
MKRESIVQKRNNQLIQWDPPTSDKVDDSKVDLVFQPFKDDSERSRFLKTKNTGGIANMNTHQYASQPAVYIYIYIYIYIKMTRMGKVQVIVTISESRTTQIIRGSYQLQSSTGKAHLAEECKFRWTDFVAPKQLQ